MGFELSTFSRLASLLAGLQMHATTSGYKVVQTRFEKHITMWKICLSLSYHDFYSILVLEVIWRTLKINLLFDIWNKVDIAFVNREIIIYRYTLFRVILGDFNYSEMQDANRYLGPIYFVTYVFIVLFVLLNMFLAIINDTYAEVKEDLAEQVDEFNINDYFKRGYAKMMKNLAFKQKTIKDIETVINSDANKDKELDYEEWRTALKA